MKTLLIIRHGDAEWKSTDGSDFSRPLSPLGTREIKNVEQQLKDKNIVLDGIIYSTAVRTFQTADIIARAFKLIENHRLAKPSLYLAHSNTIENLVFQLPDEINTIAVVAHNPGVTDYANTLVTHPFMNSMPTGAVIAVKCNSDNWADFYSGKKELLFALSPS